MPTYHFRCTDCAKEKEEKLPFGSRTKPECSTCKKPMQKIVVPPMIHFKGAGFYKTDSAKSIEKATPKQAEAPAKKDPSPKAP